MNLPRPAHPERSSLLCAARRSRVLSLALLTALVGVAPAEPSLAQEGASPRIAILTTGGTIASRTDAPMVDGPALVQAVPELLEHATITVEEFSRVGSSQMTPDHWLRLAQRINRLFEDPGLSGIVITHGTDTLEETAFFLNLTVKDERPVVVVGSMRSSNEISPDGPANLLNAVRVAAHPDAVDQGVLVVLNEAIASARDVWKTDNRRVDTFRSPELGFLGVADPDRIVFYRSTRRPHTHRSEFSVEGLESLPVVDVVVDYAGFDPQALVDAVDRRPAGVVFSTFAGGRMSAGGQQGVRDSVARGMPVAVTSRVPGGRIVGPWQPELGVVVRDLSAQKARILLMLALSTGEDRIEALQAIVDRY